MLAHLENGWQVDQAILSEEDKIVLIRFGHDWDPTCMKVNKLKSIHIDIPFIVHSLISDGRDPVRHR